MAGKTQTVAQGDDLYRLAARLYRDVAGVTILMRANGLSDPVIQDDMTLIVPAFNGNRANDGILASE